MFIWLTRTGSVRYRSGDAWEAAREKGVVIFPQSQEVGGGVVGAVKEEERTENIN